MCAVEVGGIMWEEMGEVDGRTRKEGLERD